MAISQTKQAQLTTPEAVYDQPLAPRPNGTNSGKNGLSWGNHRPSSRRRRGLCAQLCRRYAGRWFAK